jgi:hypothetical protein
MGSAGLGKGNHWMKKTVQKAIIAISFAIKS